MADVLLNIIGKIEDVKKDLAKVKTEMKNIGGQAQKANEKTRNEFNKSNQVIKNVRNQIIGMFGFAVLGSKLIQGIKSSMQVIQDFEKSFTNVLTLLDEADKKRFEGVLKEGALDLMAKYGLSIEDVNKALFDAISAGIPAGDAIKFLNESAKLATGGVTSLSTAVDGVTSVLNAYGLEASETNKITAAFFSAQKFGKTTVEELSNAIGSVAPIAKNAGVGINELLATFATLTKRGISTDETATAIRATLTALTKVTPAAAKEFKKLGIDVGVTAIREKGLAATLSQVSKAAEGNADILTELIPNVRALTGVSSLNAEALAENDEILKIINQDYGEHSSLMQAVAEQTETVDFKKRQLKGTWDKLVISIGGGDSVFTHLWKNTLTALTGVLGKLEVGLKGVNIVFSKLRGELDSQQFIEQITALYEDYTTTVKDTGIIIEETNKEIVESETKTTKVITELTKEQIKAQKDAEKAAVEKAKAIEKANEDLINKIKELQIALTQDEIEQIEKRKQLEIDNINKTLASEENKEKAIKLIRKKYNDEIKTLMDAGYADAQAKELEHQELIQQLREQYGVINLEEELNTELEILKEHFENKLLTEEEYLIAKDELIQEYAEREVGLNLEKLQKINDQLDQWAGYTANVLTSLTSLYETQKQNEIKAAGDDAKKKEEITKKYAEKQQRISLIQAIINVALGMTKALELGIPLGLIAMVLVAAAGAIQIAAIAGQKFAKGGYVGDGLGQRDETGQRQAGIVHEKEFVIDKKMTAKYRPILEAIQTDRLPTFDTDTWEKLQHKEQQFAFRHQVSLDDSKDLREIRKLLEKQNSKKEVQRFEDSQYRYEISKGFERRIKKNVN